MQKNRKLSESVSFLALKWAYTEVVIHDIKTCLVCLQVLNHEVFYLWYLTVKETRPMILESTQQASLWRMKKITFKKY